MWSCVRCLAWKVTSSGHSLLAFIFSFFCFPLAGTLRSALKTSRAIWKFSKSSCWYFLWFLHGSLLLSFSIWLFRNLILTLQLFKFWSVFPYNEWVALKISILKICFFSLARWHCWESSREADWCSLWSLVISLHPVLPNTSLLEDSQGDGGQLEAPPCSGGAVEQGHLCTHFQVGHFLPHPSDLGATLLWFCVSWSSWNVFWETWAHHYCTL